MNCMRRKRCYWLCIYIHMHIRRFSIIVNRSQKENITDQADTLSLMQNIAYENSLKNRTKEKRIWWISSSWKTSSTQFDVCLRGYKYTPDCRRNEYWLLQLVLTNSYAYDCLQKNNEMFKMIVVRIHLYDICQYHYD